MVIAVPPLVLDFRGRPYRGTDTTKWQRNKHFLPSGGFENLISNNTTSQAVLQSVEVSRKERTFCRKLKRTLKTVLNSPQMLIV